MSSTARRPTSRTPSATAQRRAARTRASASASSADARRSLRSGSDRGSAAERGGGCRTPRAGLPDPGCGAPDGLNAPAKKEIAQELVSSAENSTLDWRGQYGYIEYNVEGNRAENRGYTGGLIGFTSRTGDMLELVQLYGRLDPPTDRLTRFLPALRRVEGTPSRKGLGRRFVSAWKHAAHGRAFRLAQDHERDRVYFCPAVRAGRADGLGTLGQFIYYDALVMHGPGPNRDSFGGIRREARERAELPADGGDETAYLNAFLDVRRAAMKREEGHSDTSRIDTAQRRLLREGNLGLDPPLVWHVYGDRFEIR